MTKVISFVNSKGGAGKTTIAYCLGTLWDVWKQHVLLIDTDPQASLSTFFGVRQGKGNMEAMQISLAKLEGRLVKERDSGDHDMILIDTPGNLAELRPAIALADLVVIPVQASGADYFSFKRVFNAIQAAGTRALLVPNRIKTPRDAESIVQALGSLSGGGADISGPIGDRVNHRQYTVEGLSLTDVEARSSPGFNEIMALATKIEEMLNVQKQEPASSGPGASIAGS
jgi:chromosome partitioning protein